MTSECLTCELMARRDTGDVPLWDRIHRTPYWDVVHSYNSALPGWLVLIARRHIAALDEMTEAEAAELGTLIHKVSVALKTATGCTKTYAVQFAEAAGHAHVHFHIVPRMADLPDDYRGPNVFKYLDAPPEARVSEAAMNTIAAKVQALLNELIVQD